VWILENNPKLNPNARSILVDHRNEFFLSMESIREMAIKVRIGKMQLPGSFGSVIEAERKRLKIKLLPVKVSGLQRLSVFKSKPDHNDPADHIIICQAMEEGLTLISADQNFPSYTNSGLKLLFNNA
jgi:PIN domain nuclease of toxin-antitoxin system